MTALAAFFERRNAPSSVFRCGCCGDVLHREDHMGEAFTDAHTAAVIIEYGPEVCFGCADAFHPETDCPDCGREVCTCDDAYEQRVSDDLHGWAAE
jgi:hypothetical protein